MFDELEKKIRRIEELADSANQNANYARSYALQAMDLPVGHWIFMCVLAAILFANIVFSGFALSYAMDARDDTKYIRAYIEEKQHK